GPTQQAAGAFAQLRSVADFRRQLDDIETTHGRLAREKARSRTTLIAARDRDIAHLCEVFAIDVDAHLEGACFIATTIAEVELLPARGQGVRLLGDLGRASVYPPDGTHAAAPSRRPDKLTPEQETEQETEPAPEPAPLTVEQVDALTPEMWTAFASWIVERDGTTLD